jgi:hypothetical protein
MKLAVATSTIGRSPLMAAPMPVPMATSAMGGSQTRTALRMSTVGAVLSEVLAHERHPRVALDASVMPRAMAGRR